MSGIERSRPIQFKQSDKADELNLQQDDPRFPHVTYRRGANGSYTPVVRGIGIRVQTFVLAHWKWWESVAELANDYEVAEVKVRGALAFYEAHRDEIDANIEAEAELAREYERMREAR